MKLFCQDHPTSYVIFEGSLTCPLCDAARKLKELEEKFDDLEKEQNVIIAAVEDRIGEAEMDELLKDIRSDPGIKTINLSKKSSRHNGAKASNHNPGDSAR